MEFTVPCAKQIETWLGIVQQVGVIVGLLVTGWFFFLREEASPHVKLALESRLMPGCVVRVNANISNLGGRVWRLASAATRLYQPDTSRIPDSARLKELEALEKLVEKVGRIDLHTGASAGGFDALLSKLYSISGELALPKPDDES